MATRNTLKLKELLFTQLNDDLTLRALLGSTNRVIYGNPKNLSTYPVVAYTLMAELDNPYNIDQVSNVANTILLIECFSTEAGSAQVDAIEDRVYTLLHGQKLSNSSIQMYSIYRTSKTPVNEPDIGVIKVEATYQVYNATI